MGAPTARRRVQRPDEIRLAAEIGAGAAGVAIALDAAGCRRSCAATSSAVPNQALDGASLASGVSMHVGQRLAARCFARYRAGRRG